MDGRAARPVRILLVQCCRPWCTRSCRRGWYRWLRHFSCSRRRSRSHAWVGASLLGCCKRREQVCRVEGLHLLLVIEGMGHSGPSRAVRVFGIKGIRLPHRYHVANSAGEPSLLREFDRIGQAECGLSPFLFRRLHVGMCRVQLTRDPAVLAVSKTPVYS